MESKEPAVGTVPFELYLWLRRSPPEFSVRRCRASPMRHPSLSPSALCMPARCTMRENVWTTCAQRCADGPSAHLKSCTRQLHTPDSCLYLEMSARQCKLVLTGSSLERGRRAHQPTSSPRKGLPWQPQALSRTSALVTSPARCVGGRRAGKCALGSGAGAIERRRRRAVVAASPKGSLKDAALPPSSLCSYLLLDPMKGTTGGRMQPAVQWPHMMAWMGCHRRIVRKATPLDMEQRSGRRWASSVFSSAIPQSISITFDFDYFAS